MDLKEIGVSTWDWVDSAQARDYWRALVNATLNYYYYTGWKAIHLSSDVRSEISRLIFAFVELFNVGIELNNCK